jgi:hypothetical protein
MEELINISLGIEAFLIGFFLFRFQIMHNFVDNRKGLLRDSLNAHILNEPYLLSLIQNIGKNKDITNYFNVLVGAIHPVYKDIINEIVAIRKKYLKVWIVFIIASLIILMIIVVAATNINYSTIYNRSMSIILICFITALLTYLILDTRLTESNYSSPHNLYTALDHFIVYLFKETHKDIVSIRSKDNNPKHQFEARFNQIIVGRMNYQVYPPLRKI